MGMFSSFGKTITRALDQTVGETMPGGKAWEQRKGALGKWDPGKGWLGHATAQIYGGTTKDVFDQMQGKGDEGDDQSTAPPDLSAGEVDPDAELGALQDIRREKHGRSAMNLAPASGSSILTSR